MKFGAVEKKHRSLLDMIIQKANANQTQRIFTLLQLVAADMKANGIQQWNANYPTLAHVKNDIDAGILFALFIDDQMAAVISMDDKQSAEYADIPWEYTTGKIKVIHRLAVSPNFQRSGIGKILMDYALAEALKNDYAAIRLDAYSKNERTLNFYRNRNYKYRGKIYFPYRKDPFYCFEKKLK